MDESKSKNENHQKEQRFDRELLKKGLRCDCWQDKFLKECSEKGEEGIKKWNEWREENPDKDILLEGAELSNCFLKGVYLHHTETTKNFEKPWLIGQVYLKESKFQKASLQNARLDYANLQDAKFYLSSLGDADFGHACMKGAEFNLSTVMGTVFWGYEIDRDTDFRGVALDTARIDPGLKQLLEYNIRRKNWEAWYTWKDWNKYDPKKRRESLSQALRCPIRWFWAISDYGRSTGRIIFTFFGLALIFANIYYHWGRIAPPGIVDNLFVDRNGIEVQWWLVPLRTLYFSIVTMTTLGFGDMYSNAHSVWGHVLLSIQVILGYVLLGALVTRFAVLFTAGGPAGKFSNENKGSEK